MDVPSISSDESIRVPPRLDKARIVPGPGALPPSTFDPLRTVESWDPFWNAVDNFFQPINLDDLSNLASVASNPYGGIFDPHLRLSRSAHLDHNGSTELNKGPPPHAPSVQKLPPATKNTLTPSSNNECATKLQSTPHLSPTKGKTSQWKKFPPSKSAHSPVLSHAARPGSATAKGNSDGNMHVMDVSHPVQNASTGTASDSGAVLSSLNSFPFTCRLIAAFLDENGPSGTPMPNGLSSRSNRLAPEDRLWIGVGSDADVHHTNSIYEHRVKCELREVGLLRQEDDDSLQTAMRADQWRLRELKTFTRNVKVSIFKSGILPQLKNQSLQREFRRHEHQLEMAYLERMINRLKKNKKSRSKFQKLLQRSFGHYKDNQEKGICSKTSGTVGHSSVTHGRAEKLSEPRSKSKSAAKKKRKKIEPTLHAQAASKHGHTPSGSDH